MRTLGLKSTVAMLVSCAMSLTTLAEMPIYRMVKAEKISSSGI